MMTSKKLHHDTRSETGQATADSATSCEREPDSGWTADITNDPDKDYRLNIILEYGDEIVGCVERGSAGQLELKLYPHAEHLRIPLAWLTEIAGRAEGDLPWPDESCSSDKDET